MPDELRVLVRQGTTRMADIKAYAAEIGATVDESPIVPAGQMFVMNLEKIEAETNVWLSRIKE